MTGSAGEEGGDQKAVQLATAASSVLNAKAGKSSGNDSGAEQERAAVSKYTNFKQINAIVFCREFIRYLFIILSITLSVRCRVSFFLVSKFFFWNYKRIHMRLRNESTRPLLKSCRHFGKLFALAVAKKCREKTNGYFPYLELVQKCGMVSHRNFASLEKHALNVN